MTLPAAYRWLTTLGLLPRVISEALKEYGTIEVPGPGNNPKIVGWGDEIGGAVDKAYTADSIPWCGLFAAIVCKRAGKAIPDAPLWALNWAKFGVKADRPSLGDVLVFKRNGGGHVGFYVGEDPGAFHVLGGNQSDAVTITRIAKDRLYAVRRPVMKVPPASMKPYQLAAAGKLSVNEA